MFAPEAREPLRARYRRFWHAALVLGLVCALGRPAGAEPVEAAVPGSEASPLVLVTPEAPPPPATRDGYAPMSDDALDALSAELDANSAKNPDPFEGVNRQVFAFNRGVDAVLFDPISRAYRFVLGDFARQSIRNAFANLKTPVVLANNLLQLHPQDAAVTTARFVVNSTLGMGGLFDPASSFGLDARIAGFSDTLEAAGVTSGPYLVLPIFGPTTVRDGFGNLVDAAMAPQTYILPVVGTMVLTGSSGVVERDRYFEGLEALRESSIDYYASLRSAYLAPRPSTR
jgi:phospholipid-binding lipoprotein MlaA